jgi:preprotein translocase subunit YajC
MSTLLMLAGMFAIMYLFMIRPQMKRQKEARAFRDAVKKGDQVVTIGGLHGKVVSVSEKTVVLEFESGKARVDKTALSATGSAETQELEAKAS